MLELFVTLGLSLTQVDNYYQWERVQSHMEVRQDTPKKAYEINEYVNKYVKYENDPLDVWQTPQETIAKGTGDCEDYAILKYAMLKKAGKNPILVLVKSHMVVVVDGWVMDNKKKRMYRFNMKPIKVFNVRGTFEVERKSK